MKRLKDRKLRFQIRKLWPLLSILKEHSTDKETRNAVLDFINDEGISVICCCVDRAFNAQDMPEGLKDLLKKNLHAYKKPIRYIIRNKNNPKGSRKRLKQTGGGIGMILAAALPVLANLILNK